MSIDLGTGGYLERTSGPLDHNADYTVMVWVNFHNGVAGPGTVWWSGDDPSTNAFDTLQRTGGTWYMKVDARDNSASTENIGASNLTADTWYHFAVVRSANTLYGYLNGVSECSIATTISGRNPAVDQRIGGWVSAGDKANAVVTGAKAWNRALTASEVSSEMTSFWPLSATNLWATWRLPGTGDVTDSSGNGRNWSTGGTPSNSSDPSITSFTALLYPTTSATSAVAGTSENAEAWQNPSNVSSDNGATASITAATFDSPDISDRLVMSAFGAAIPSTATVEGLRLEIDRNNAAGAASDNRVQLLNETGAVAGNNNADTATDWPASLSIVTYGSNGTRWGVALTPTITNDTDFGVALSVQADAANTDIAVDFVRMTIYYSPRISSGGAAVPDTWMYRRGIQGVFFG